MFEFCVTMNKKISTGNVEELRSNLIIVRKMVFIVTVWFLESVCS